MLDIAARHRVTTMPMFLVERYVPSAVPADIEAAVERLAGDDADRTTDVRHLWTALIAVDETCLSLFEASSADAVERANQQAGFPFDRIIEAAVIAAPVGRSRLSSRVVARRGSPR